MTLGRGFSNAYFLYKRKVVAPHPEPHCRHHPDCRPVRHCRPTWRDTDVKRTWVAFQRLGPTRAPRGALWHIHRTCEREACGSDLARFARLPDGRTAPDQPGFSSAPDHHRPPRLFASKGSVCWSLLVPEHPLFTSRTTRFAALTPQACRSSAASVTPIISSKQLSSTGAASSDAAARYHLPSEPIPVPWD